MLPESSRSTLLGNLAAAPLMRAASARTARPNVLLILTDDHGYGDLSCHGNLVLSTPHQERPHAESVRFTYFHSAAMCTSTRGQLLPGVGALRNKACSVTAGRVVVRRDLPAMADAFRSRGYRAGLFGKWRVVHGEELYDSEAGPSESLNLAAQHPEVRARMRDHYEQRWASVKPGLGEPEPISIGAPQENPTVQVERSGRYEVALSRWPPHLRLALTAGRDEQKMRTGLPPGKAMPVAGARLEVGGQSFSSKTGWRTWWLSFRCGLPVDSAPGCTVGLQTLPAPVSAVLSMP